MLKGEENTYGYDKAGRLKQVSDEAGSTAYIYDRNENIGTLKSVTMTYDKASWLATYKGEEVTYDAEGNWSAQANTKTGIRTEYVVDTVSQLSQVIMEPKQAVVIQNPPFTPMETDY